MNRWDERFARREELHGFVPSPLLLDALAGARMGDALDLACGAGRHALALAERGFRVDAVDGSRVGLAILEDEAARRGLRDRLTLHHADLESDPPGFALPPARYDLVLDFHFLHRPLLALVPPTVRPGGLFVAAIHYAAPGAERPHAFLLQPGELLTTVAAWGFEVLHASEGPSREPGHRHATAEIIARAR